MRMHVHQNEDFHIPTKIPNHPSKRTSSQIQKNHNNQTSGCSTWHFHWTDYLYIISVFIGLSNIIIYCLIFNSCKITNNQQQHQGSSEKLNKQVHDSFEQKSKATDIYLKQSHKPIKCYRQNEHNNVHTLTVIVPLVLPKDQGPMSVRVPQNLRLHQGIQQGKHNDRVQRLDQILQ